jgi:hypothetical protein
MNHPTWEDFHRLESEQKRLREEHEVLKRRLEQRTDEMKAINVNVASADVITHLDALEQKIDTVQENTNRVTIQVEGARADISQLKESQADMRDKLVEHSEDLKAIKETQERHTEVLGQLMNFGEGIKTDIVGLKTDVSSIKSIQTEQSELLRQILAKLQ